MKNTEDKIKTLFIKKLKTTPLEEINVLSLTKELNIKRQTFYYHYQDIYDLIVSIFYSEKIEINKNYSFKENIGLLEAFLKNNEVLCKGICSSYAENILGEYINSFVFRLLEFTFRNHSSVRKIANFYSKSIGNLILTLYKNDEFTTNKFISELNEIKDAFKYINI